MVASGKGHLWSEYHDEDRVATKETRVILPLILIPPQPGPFFAHARHKVDIDGDATERD